MELDMGSHDEEIAPPLFDEPTEVCIRVELVQRFPQLVPRRIGDEERLDHVEDGLTELDHVRPPILRKGEGDMIGTEDLQVPRILMLCPQRESAEPIALSGLMAKTLDDLGWPERAMRAGYVRASFLRYPCLERLTTLRPGTHPTVRVGPHSPDREGGTPLNEHARGRGPIVVAHLHDDMSANSPAARAHGSGPPRQIRRKT